MEAYTYHCTQKNVLVDDIKTNVAFVWDAETASDTLQPQAIANEIDIIFTKNMQTFFISCKQSPPKTEFLEEIRFMADYFGIDGKAILVTSNWRTSEIATKSDSGAKRANDLIADRAHKMQVYYIDRQMIGDSCSSNNSNRLSQYIQNIVDGKPDWDRL